MRGAGRACEVRYYILSRLLTAEEFAGAVRRPLGDRDPPARRPTKRQLVRRRKGRLPSP